MVINSQLAPCQQSFRITLNLTVDQDFNPRQIDYQRLFDLSEWESINTHIEELQKPITLHFTGYTFIFWQPIKCSPSVRSESGESPKAPTEIISKERHHGPISIQVLIMIRLITASANCKRYRQNRLLTKLLRTGNPQKQCS